jgi:hypothetical protein
MPRKELTVAKRKAKALELEFVAKLGAARSQLSADDVQTLVLSIVRSDLTEHLNAHVSNHRELVAAALENWWDKYTKTLRSLEAERDSASGGLAVFLRELGYE